MNKSMHMSKLKPVSKLEGSQASCTFAIETTYESSVELSHRASGRSFSLGSGSFAADAT